MELELFLEADYSKVKKTSIVRTEVYPIIEKQMPNRWSAVKKEIGRFITTHHEELYAPAPYTRLIFNQNDYDAFWNALGIPKKTITNMMKNCFFWDLNFNPRCAKNPFSAAMLCIVRYHLKKGNIKDAKLAAMYLALSGQYYASVHYSFFLYLPNKNIMDYAINVKMTEKFALRKTGSIFGAIDTYVDSWIAQYKKDIVSNDWDDDDYARVYIQQLHDRVKAFMKGISKLYYEADENKEYLNFSTDNVEEDNYHLASSNSAKADKYTENAVNYMTTKEINYKFCGMVKDQNVSRDEIKSIMDSIFHNKDNIPDLKKVTNILIANFINEYPEEPITGVKFMNYAMQTKPNSQDKNVVFVRTQIIQWLNTNSIDYVRRKSRPATASSYFKAVLKMIVLCISAANK